MPAPPEPSPEQLRDALWASFATSPASMRLERAPARLADLVGVLDADLRIPGDKRARKPIPRVVLGVAVWTLALRHLDPTEVPHADQAALQNLDTLVKNVFGWGLSEIGAMRRQNIDPLLMVARQYGILDYRWEPSQLSPPPAAAKLELLVQRPLEQLIPALDPAQWSSKCELLWGNVVPVEVRSPERQGPTRTFTAELKLPGAGQASASVLVESDVVEIPFGVRNNFKILLDRRDQTPFLICEGLISAEKEAGQPWATRVKQEKRMLVLPELLDGHGENTLTYWMQAESVCLVVPH